MTDLTVWTISEPRDLRRIVRWYDTKFGIKD